MGCARLVHQQVGVEVLHRLADLDEPDPHSVEDQTIRERAAPQVTGDGCGGLEDVEQPVTIATGSLTAGRGPARCRREVGA